MNAPADRHHLPSAPDGSITRRLAELATAAQAAALATAAQAAAPTGGHTVDAATVVPVVEEFLAALTGAAEDVIAWPSVELIPVAVVALLASGVTDVAALSDGIDLAASLMVLTDPQHPIAAHHAVGELVPALLASGVTPLPGALNHTLSAAIGRPVTLDCSGGDQACRSRS